MREKQGKEGMKKRKGGAGQRIREAKQRRVTLEHGTKEEAEEEGETFWKPRLHFQQRHIRFSFRRVSFGFVCSRWTGASTFLQFQQLWSDRCGGPGPGKYALARAVGGPLPSGTLRSSRP